MLAPGTHAHSVVELIDVFPTLAQLANVASPSYLDGTEATLQHSDSINATRENTTASTAHEGENLKQLQQQQHMSYFPLPFGLDGQSLAGLVLGDPSGAGSHQSSHVKKDDSGNIKDDGSSEQRLLGANAKTVAVAQWFGGAVPTLHNPLVNPCAVYAVLISSPHQSHYLHTCVKMDKVLSEAILHFIVFLLLQFDFCACVFNHPLSNVLLYFLHGAVLYLRWLEQPQSSCDGSAILYSHTALPIFAKPRSCINFLAYVQKNHTTKSRVGLH
jgi:hypothetical protein